MEDLAVPRLVERLRDAVRRGLPDPLGRERNGGGYSLPPQACDLEPAPTARAEAPRKAPVAAAAARLRAEGRGEVAARLEQLAAALPGYPVVRAVGTGLEESDGVQPAIPFTSQAPLLEALSALAWSDPRRDSRAVRAAGRLAAARASSRDGPGTPAPGGGAGGSTLVARAPPRLSHQHPPLTPDDGDIFDLPPDPHALGGGGDDDGGGGGRAPTGTWGWARAAGGGGGATHGSRPASDEPRLPNRHPDDAELDGSAAALARAMAGARPSWPASGPATALAPGALGLPSNLTALDGAPGEGTAFSLPGGEGTPRSGDGDSARSIGPLSASGDASGRTSGSAAAPWAEAAAHGGGPELQRRPPPTAVERFEEADRRLLRQALRSLGGSEAAALAVRRCLAASCAAPHAPPPDESTPVSAAAAEVAAGLLTGAARSARVRRHAVELAERGAGGAEPVPSALASATRDALLAIEAEAEDAAEAAEAPRAPGGGSGAASIAIRARALLGALTALESASGAAVAAGDPGAALDALLRLADARPGAPAAAARALLWPALSPVARALFDAARGGRDRELPEEGRGDGRGGEEGGRGARDASAADGVPDGGDGPVSRALASAPSLLAGAVADALSAGSSLRNLRAAPRASGAAALADGLASLADEAETAALGADEGSAAFDPGLVPSWSDAFDPGADPSRGGAPEAPGWARWLRADGAAAARQARAAAGVGEAALAMVDGWLAEGARTRAEGRLDAHAAELESAAELRGRQARAAGAAARLAAARRAPEVAGGERGARTAVERRAEAEAAAAEARARELDARARGLRDIAAIRRAGDGAGGWARPEARAGEGARAGAWGEAERRLRFDEPGELETLDPRAPPRPHPHLLRLPAAHPRALGRAPAPAATPAPAPPRPAPVPALLEALLCSPLRALRRAAGAASVRAAVEGSGLVERALGLRAIANGERGEWVDALAAAAARRGGRAGRLGPVAAAEALAASLSALAGTHPPELAAEALAADGEAGPPGGEAGPVPAATRAALPPHPRDAAVRSLNLRLPPPRDGLLALCIPPAARRDAAASLAERLRVSSARQALAGARAALRLARRHAHVDDELARRLAAALAGPEAALAAVGAQLELEASGDASWVDLLAVIVCTSPEAAAEVLVATRPGDPTARLASRLPGAGARGLAAHGALRAAAARLELAAGPSPAPGAPLSPADSDLEPLSRHAAAAIAGGGGGGAGLAPALPGWWSPGASTPTSSSASTRSRSPSPWPGAARAPATPVDRAASPAGSPAATPPPASVAAPGSPRTAASGRGWWWTPLPAALSRAEPRGSWADTLAAGVDPNAPRDVGELRDAVAAAAASSRRAAETLGDPSGRVRAGLDLLLGACHAAADAAAVSAAGARREQLDGLLAARGGPSDDNLEGTPVNSGAVSLPDSELPSWRRGRAPSSPEPGCSGGADPGSPRGDEPFSLVRSPDLVCFSLAARRARTPQDGSPWEPALRALERAGRACSALADAVDAAAGPPSAAAAGRAGPLDLLSLALEFNGYYARGRSLARERRERGAVERAGRGRVLFEGWGEGRGDRGRGEVPPGPPSPPGPSLPPGPPSPPGPSLPVGPSAPPEAGPPSPSSSDAPPTSAAPGSVPGLFPDAAASRAAAVEAARARLRELESEAAAARARLASERGR